MRSGDVGAQCAAAVAGSRIPVWGLNPDLALCALRASGAARSTWELLRQIQYSNGNLQCHNWSLDSHSRASTSFQQHRYRFSAVLDRWPGEHRAVDLGMLYTAVCR